MPLSFQDKITPVSGPAPTSNSSGLSFASKITPVSQPNNSPGFLANAGNVIKGVGNVLTSSEQNFGQDIAAGASAILPGSWTGVNDLNKGNQMLHDADYNYLKQVNVNLNAAKQRGDQAAVDRYNTAIKNFHLSDGTKLSDLYPSLNKSNLQVAGDAAGVLADILSVGSYGNAAKGAETGKLLTKSGGIIDNLATKVGIGTTAKEAALPVAKQALGATLKTIGKETALHSAIGGATGYGYDVVNNAQAGKTGGDLFKPGAGTATGVILPLAIGAIRAGAAVTKDLAPRIVNSLVKPSKANFAYGHNPGATVSEMGITGNNLEDFGNNVSAAKEDVGQKIGQVYDNPANANIKIDGSSDVGKIDAAIADAARGGKNNQGIVNTLQNVKEALLYPHTIDDEGNIVKASESPKVTEIIKNTIASGNQMLDSIASGESKGTVEQALSSVRDDIANNLEDKRINLPDVADRIRNIDVSKFTNSDITDKGSMQALYDAVTDKISAPRDLSNLTPKETQALIQDVTDHTKFTGSPSDDKKVNSILQNIYGGLREKVTNAVAPNNPEIEKLNEQYGNLKSAELAIKNRDAIVSRNNLISMPVKVGGVAALGTAVASGGAAIPTALAGVSAALLDKALGSTAVKTRIAAWLGNESPGIVNKLLQNNPEIAPILRRAFPYLASKLGK